MAGENNSITTGELKKSFHERKKVFFVYDGSARVIDIYEAQIGTSDQGKCLRTTYTYVGATNRVEKFKETNDVWDTATMEI